MKRKVGLDTWIRKPHFEFFRAFEEPYYGVCVKVDCSAAYRFAKSNGISFFLYYLYQSLAAAQQIEPFKQRIENDEVYLYERIDPVRRFRAVTAPSDTAISNIRKI